MKENSIRHIYSRAYTISLIEVIVSSIYGGLTGGMITVGILMFLGGGNFEIALLSSCGSVAGFFSVFSVLSVKRFGQRKNLTLLTFVISRFLFSLLLVIIFLQFPGRSVMMLFIVFVSSIFGSISGTIWLSWITSLIPSRVWGKYFSRRSIFASVTGMFVPILAGYLIDNFKRRDAQREGFAILLGAGVVLSILSCFLLQKIPEQNERKNSNHSSVRDILRIPLKDGDFMAFVRFIFFFTFFNSFAGPFYVPHMINNLHMSFTRISLYGFVAGGIGLYFRHLWGKLVDRYGPRPLLRNAMWGIFPLPMIWLFATPSFQFPIWLDAFITGVFWTGVDITLVVLLLGLSGKEEKEAYYSAYTIFGALAGLCGSLCGGTFAKLTNGFHFRFLGQDFVNYHLHFLISSLSRLWTMRLAMKIPAKKTEKVQHFPGIFPIVYDELWKVLSGASRITRSIFSFHFLKQKEDKNDNEKNLVDSYE